MLIGGTGGRKGHSRVVPGIPADVTKHLPYSNAWSHSGPLMHKGIQMSSNKDKDSERHKWADDRSHSQPVGMLVQVDSAPQPQNPNLETRTPKPKTQTRSLQGARPSNPSQSQTPTYKFQHPKPNSKLHIRSRR